MHERSMVRALLRHVERLMDGHPGCRVAAVRVRIGTFAGVQGELFQSAFDELVPDTPADGARLEVETVPLAAICDVCRHEFQVEGFRFACPRCGQGAVTIVAGEEVLLESLVMEHLVDE